MSKHEGENMDPVEALRVFISQSVRDELRKIATAPPDEYISPTDAAKVADVATVTIRRWVRDGKLRNYHAGRLVRISRHDLDRLLRDGTAKNDSLTPEQRAARKYG